MNLREAAFQPAIATVAEGPHGSRVPRPNTRLLETLAQDPNWEEMLVVITADHGEALGEHSDVGHGTSLYDEQIRVPFFVKPGRHTPGAPEAGSKLAGPLMSVDVLPMVLQHAGLPDLEGVDGIAWGRNHARVFTWVYRTLKGIGALERFNRELRSVEEGGWKLISSTRDPPELFDLSTDPHELRNLAAEEPARRFALLAALGPRKSFIGSGTPSPTPLSRETEKRLRELGYIE